MVREAGADGGGVAVGLVCQRLSAMVRKSLAYLSHPTLSWTSKGTGSPGLRFWWLWTWLPRRVRLSCMRMEMMSDMISDSGPIWRPGLNNLSMDA